jgi:hypothetical protein
VKLGLIWNKKPKTALKLIELDVKKSLVVSISQKVQLGFYILV